MYVLLLSKLEALGAAFIQVAHAQAGHVTSLTIASNWLAMAARTARSRAAIIDSSSHCRTISVSLAVDAKLVVAFSGADVDAATEDAVVWGDGESIVFICSIMDAAARGLSPSEASTPSPSFAASAPDKPPGEFSFNGVDQASRSSWERDA